MGSAEHGLRSTEARIFPEISDKMSFVLPKQAGIRSQLHRGQVTNKFLFLIECKNNFVEARLQMLMVIS